MLAGDTIMALSSGALPSGVAVIRLSGPKVREAFLHLAGHLPAPRAMALRRIGADTQLDQGLVAWFPGPHSFTGEDCAEFHVHGSPAGVKAILRELGTLGIRLAGPGEFTRRAFENGKLDLIAVEGLGDLLSAETEKQRQQALARYDGRLTEKVETWRDVLLDLRAEIEARLDFSDEGDVTEELPASFSGELEALKASLVEALGSINSGRIVREGVRVALAGAPNAGKSSLINALSKSDIAIVSDEAGTTRDVREVPLDIGGQLFVLLDLAGLRQTDSRAEAEGIRRAERAIQDADILLWLEAPDTEIAIQPVTNAKVVRIGTKSDLAASNDHDLQISTTNGSGLDALIDQLRTIGENLVGGEPSLISHERDRSGLEQAIAAVDESVLYLSNWELAAEALRHASLALERMIGRVDAEQVLDRLFSSFCIGK
ncbi:tRNA uridine-5-carboxymethylaminomethyl(34) synthesis GTPase MnmE [Devosia sp.]|uniref:tRNA uridine-5-carboxymethylaminomethyl(34) synthesis GTPase MnmE n=1 Tax=Devosia sp. TaxID=1871048 RepID=UPI001AD43A0D|nr:tRNA uridine-5-carboxymethylaminomethyl(34) synthesis GTPase MnmE [Devosia sp.]MBN9332835.1 tRNA uridine-5-carboxymethylaminomethyl(34) synthesis GTPase MnmE [Devosia sp.]